MKLIPLLKQAITRNDFFYSTQLLRFKQQSQYRTFTGGLLSLGIIIFIIIGFASMIISMLNRTSISTTFSVQKKTDPTLITLDTSPQKKFMFGAQIWRHDLNANKRYFDVFLAFYTYNQSSVYSNIVYSQLVPCTRQHWSQFPEVINKFQKLQISYWLCPPINFTFDIYGKYSSIRSQNFGVQIYPCNNATDPSRPCATQAQIDALFLANYNSFYFTFYTINQIVNPDKTDYISYYLEDKNYVRFGSTFASETYLYITDYTIQTDNSIWPFESLVVDKGFFSQNFAFNHPLQYSAGNPYVGFYMEKSSNSYQYKRVVLKISEVFSFIGGIIGAVFAVLFFLKNFTDFSLETVIALTVFRKKKEESLKQIQEKQEDAEDEQQLSGNFFKFIKYGIYELSRSVGKQIQWKDMKKLKQYRKQILKQLDIQSIIKRLIFLEHSITYLLQDFQIEGLQLQRPVTPEQIKKLRQRCHFEEELHSEQSEEVQEYPIKQKQFDQVIEKSPSQNSVRDFTTYQVLFKSKQGSPEIKQETLSPNLNQKNDLIILSVSDCSRGGGGKVVNSYRPSIDIRDLDQIQGIFPQKKQRNSRDSKLKRRQSYLKNLQESMQKGNVLSKRIWVNLQQKSEKQINHLSPLSPQNS